MAKTKTDPSSWMRGKVNNVVGVNQWTGHAKAAVNSVRTSIANYQSADSRMAANLASAKKSAASAKISLASATASRASARNSAVQAWSNAGKRDQRNITMSSLAESNRKKTAEDFGVYASTTTSKGPSNQRTAGVATRLNRNVARSVETLQARDAVNKKKGPLTRPMRTPAQRIGDNSRESMDTLQARYDAQYRTSGPKNKRR